MPNLPGAAPLHLAVQLEKVEAVEASVATQGAVDPLVGPHRCQRGYSKTVLTAMVCFLQFPQMGWLDQNAQMGCRNDEVASLNPHQIIES